MWAAHFTRDVVSGMRLWAQRVPRADIADMTSAAFVAVAEAIGEGFTDEEDLRAAIDWAVCRERKRLRRDRRMLPLKRSSPDDDGDQDSDPPAREDTFEAVADRDEAEVAGEWCEGQGAGGRVLKARLGGATVRQAAQALGLSQGQAHERGRRAFALARERFSG